MLDPRLAQMRAEMAVLERDLRRAGVIAEHIPEHPSLDAWKTLIRNECRALVARLDELDAGDRAFVAWSEATDQHALSCPDTWANGDPHGDGSGADQEGGR